MEISKYDIHAVRGLLQSVVFDIDEISDDQKATYSQQIAEQCLQILFGEDY